MRPTIGWGKRQINLDTKNGHVAQMRYAAGAVIGWRESSLGYDWPAIPDFHVGHTNNCHHECFPSVILSDAAIPQERINGPPTY